MPACGLDTFGLTNEPAVTTSGGLTTQEMPPGSTAVTATTGELSTEPTTLSSTDSGHSSGGASMGTTEGPTSSTGDGTTGQSGTTGPTTGRPHTARRERDERAYWRLVATARLMAMSSATVTS